jgi:hypothetical protein
VSGRIIRGAWGRAEVPVSIGPRRPGGKSVGEPIWFKDAKFGIMMRWGAHSVQAMYS